MEIAMRLVVELSWCAVGLAVRGESFRGDCRGVAVALAVGLSMAVVP